MRIAVTGATGFLGKYLVKHLINCSYDVLVIARPEEDAKECFPFKVPIFESNYSPENLLKAFNGIETVIHLAAQTMQRDTDPFRVSQFFPVNVKITENVLVAASKIGVKQVCQMSSNSVYSSANKLPFSETDNPIPSTIYGVSKLYAEKLGEFIAQKSGLNVVSLRLARLFGYGERETVVFTKYMNLASQGKMLEVWGNGNTSIEYIYIKDVIDGIQTAIDLGINSGIYNLGTNKSFSILEIAESINNVCNNLGNLIIDRSKQEEGYNILMDSTKFYEICNWHPKWNLVDAIHDMYKYYKETK